MVGSIDPRCEILRGIHWHKTGRVVVWNSRRGNHLGQRSKPTASTGRTYGCKRSDQTSEKLLAARGPSTYGSRPLRGLRRDELSVCWLAMMGRSDPSDCRLGLVVMLRQAHTKRLDEIRDLLRREVPRVEPAQQQIELCGFFQFLGGEHGRLQRVAANNGAV